MVSGRSPAAEGAICVVSYSFSLISDLPLRFRFSFPFESVLLTCWKLNLCIPNLNLCISSESVFSDLQLHEFLFVRSYRMYLRYENCMDLLCMEVLELEILGRDYVCVN
ncbi:hypothetical protein Hanom_Chr06g00534241 [Helianthus anomalus]